MYPAPSTNSEKTRTPMMNRRTGQLSTNCTAADQSTDGSVTAAEKTLARSPPGARRAHSPLQKPGLMRCGVGRGDAHVAIGKLCGHPAPRGTRQEADLDEVW